MDNINVFAVIGTISLILALILAYYYRSAKQAIDEMWAVDTYDAKDLKQLCSDGFNATVEVQGQVTCDNPVTSLVSGLPCCWFRTIVEREEEHNRIVFDTNSEGHQSSRTETDRSWKRDFDRTYTAVFKVHDQTGYTLVDPVNADIDSEEVCNSIYCERLPWFDGVAFSNTNRYRIKEEVFIPTGYAYVLGEASACADDVLMHYPKAGYMDPKKKLFFISRKTEKQLTQSKQITLSISFWFSAIAFLFSVFCFCCAAGIINVPVQGVRTLQP